MGDLFSYELLPVIFNMTVTASVVILVVLLVRLLLKKLSAPAVVSYALWAVVLFRLLCPVSVTAPVSLFGALNAPAVATESGATTIEYVPREIVHMENPVVELPIPAVGDAISAVLPQGEEQLRADPLEGPMFLLSMVWLGGLLVLVLYSIVSYLRLRAKLLGATPLDKNIRLADHITSPFVMGLFRPKIYLPSGLSEREREYIILHEQHHIRRWDHIVKILAFVALCVHWFNPLVWLAFCLSGKDMEMSCDEAVVKKLGEDIRADYAASLLNLATGRTLVAATPLAFGEGDPEGRIKNLEKWKKPALCITVVAVILCAVVIALCATNAGRETQVKVRMTGDGTEVTCRFGSDAADYAIYEDVYLQGERISSEIVLLNGEHPDRANGSKLFYVLNAATEYAENGGFTGTLTFSATDKNGTILRRELILPRDHYTGCARVLGDGSRQISSGHWELQEGDETILFSVILSTKSNGSITAMHKELGITGTNDTVVQYRLVTSDTVQNWSDGEPEPPPRQYGPDRAYVSERCLYLAPYSSYYPAGGDSGYRYLMGDDGFYMVNRSSGVKTELASGADWETWSDIPWSFEEWEDLFWFEGTDIVAWFGAVERKYCPLTENMFLLRVDGVLWIVTLNLNPQMGTHIYSIYTLTPELAKGGAQWEYAPIFSSRSPWFRFEFDMEYDAISAACSERMLEDVDGENARDYALMFPAGHAVYWSPVDDGSTAVGESTIHFTALRDGKNICTGTIYIRGSRIEESGTTLYVANLVGTGLVMEQNPESEGAVIRLG